VKKKLTYYLFVLLFVLSMAWVFDTEAVLGSVATASMVFVCYFLFLGMYQALVYSLILRKRYPWFSCDQEQKEECKAEKKARIAFLETFDRLLFFLSIFFPTVLLEIYLKNEIEFYRFIAPASVGVFLVFAVYYINSSNNLKKKECSREDTEMFSKRKKLSFVFTILSVGCFFFSVYKILRL
jgi:hypothetical protein